VSALIVADGTPPDVFTYLPDGTGLGIPNGLVSGTRTLAVLRMFGLGPKLGPQEAPPGDTAIARALEAVDTQLADVIDAYRAFTLVPDWATVSVFEEWRDPKLVADLVVYDHELGDLPVFVVTPAGKATPAEVQAIGVSQREVERAQNFLEQARMRYVRISRRSALIHTAPGTTHLYPFETPDALLVVVRRILADGPTGALAGFRTASNLVTHSEVTIDRPAARIWPYLLDPNGWKQGAKAWHHAGPAGQVGEVFGAGDPAAKDQPAFLFENVELVPGRRRTIKLSAPAGALLGYASWWLREQGGRTVVGYDVFTETLADAALVSAPAAEGRRDAEAVIANKARFDQELLALKRLVEAGR
jgi:hypothetical protein